MKFGTFLEDLFFVYEQVYTDVTSCIHAKKKNEMSYCTSDNGRPEWKRLRKRNMREKKEGAKLIFNKSNTIAGDDVNLERGQVDDKTMVDLLKEQQQTKQ